jgi:methionyl-tRNA synthetase
VPIPWDPEQVTWVWVDALINYLSALTYARPGEDLRERYWPDVRHLIGKDILRLHCVLWPALLLAAGYTLPKQVFVHGFLLLDDRKISKTLGNVIDPLDLTGVYGIDPVRFWAARAVQFGQDGSVSLDSLHERYEKELGNDLGNLLSRTTAMLVKYRDGHIPAAESLLETVSIDELRTNVAERLDVFDITGALDVIWDLVRQLNKLVTDTKPWELAKDDANAAQLDRVLYTLADGLRATAVALAAYLPETSPRILEALGQTDDLAWENVAVGKTVPTGGIEAAQPLFPRLEAPATAA